MKISIYYFTGTGNSRLVAEWVKNQTEENGGLAIMTNIAKTDRINIPQPPKDSLVVFISPIHGFNYPPVMVNFIARFPKGKNKVLLMNTRAGMLIGKFITPGLTGVAFFFSSLLLKLKGYTTVGMIPVDLPSNWISVHPGLNSRTIKYLHEQNLLRVRKAVGKVLVGGKNFKALREVVQDILISPISVLYYFIGRFFFAKTYYASSDCDNCNLCIKNCPVKAIKEVDGRPFWTFKCESCMRCMSNCHKKAIETAHGSIIVFSIIFSTIITAFIYKVMGQLSLPVDSEIFREVISTVFFLALLIIWYRISHLLLRFRWFERIMVYTSLTKYKWWGRRYKAGKSG